MGMLQKNRREVSLRTASENADASLALKNMTVYIGMTYIYQIHMNIYRIYIPIDIVILLHVVDSGEPCGSIDVTSS